MSESLKYDFRNQSFSESLTQIDSQNRDKEALIVEQEKKIVSVCHDNQHLSEQVKFRSWDLK